MFRDLEELARHDFDVVVVGGGIFGIATARDAALRGLTVALVERDDFAAATSANSFKIVHGGIRYLQHLDIPRIRESSRERSALLRIAPHLVQPLPIVVPTYGRGAGGKTVLRAGLATYDALVWDRNRHISDPARQIPGSYIISKAECLAHFPDLDSNALTGAAVFYDGQMYNPPRLALSVLRSAVAAGALAANHVEVTDFLRAGERVRGVRVRDRLNGDEFEIHAKVVVNAAGPWAESLFASSFAEAIEPASTFSRDACFVIPRRHHSRYALAVPATTSDPGAVVSRGKRHLFVVPWRDCTLVGVWHRVHRGSPEDFTVTDDELQGFVDEVNEGYPALSLSVDDLSHWHAGLVLFGRNEPGATNLRYGTRSRVIDHSRTHRVQGLVTVVGVRWTTARGIADRAVRLIFGKLGRRTPPCTSHTTPVHGGAIDRFEDLRHAVRQACPEDTSEDTINQLAHNYGTEYTRVLAYAKEQPALSRPMGDSSVLGAEVVHAVREEMACQLADVVFRRTDLGTGRHPGEEAITSCARIMSEEHGWSPERTESEIQDVRTKWTRPTPSARNRGAA